MYLTELQKTESIIKYYKSCPNDSVIWTSLLLFLIISSLWSMDGIKSHRFGNVLINNGRFHFRMYYFFKYLSTIEIRQSKL